MGKPVIRKTVDFSTGHVLDKYYPPVPAIQSSNNVFANGHGVVRQGDKFDKHLKIYHGGTAVGTSSKVFVNGKPIVRQGDPISCGDKTNGGSPTVSAG